MRNWDDCVESSAHSISHLKKSLASDQLEDLVTLQYRNGAEMGSINHSRRLIMECRDVLHDVIMEKLRRHIASQPCMALLADKVTVARRTLDITAVMTIAPGALSEYQTDTGTGYWCTSGEG